MQGFKNQQIDSSTVENLIIILEKGIHQKDITLLQCFRMNTSGDYRKKP